jgi:acetyltransferase-like isoleucine patch superfamily enzyme
MSRTEQPGPVAPKPENRITMVLFKKLALLFLRLSYKHAEGADPFKVIGSVFFMQKIIGFNRRIGWPVHFTSRILNPKSIKLGSRSFPGWSHGCYIQAKNGIEIGDNLRMGPNVGLISADHDINDYDKWNYVPPIRIGNNVWIGMNSVVLPGVEIGDNVIIGANSVVTRDIPSNSIAAGNPCKTIKQKPPYQGKQY